MRLLYIIPLLFLCVSTSGQEVKPKIVGQKLLSTNEGKSITIQLSDLTVEETVTGNGPGGGNDNDNTGNNDQGNDAGNNDDNDDNDQQEDDENSDDENNGGGNESDGDDEGDHDADDDDESDDDKDDDDGGENDDNKGKDNGGDGDKKDDKGKKDNKGKKGDKEDKQDKGGGGKGKKGDKGKGKSSSGRSAYPVGYALEIFAGPNYTFAGNTITPTPGFTGTLSVPVRVKNEKHASPRYTVSISVIAASPALPVNDPPVITGQQTLKTAANTPIQIKFSHLQVSDPDDKYPEGFTLALQPGENYSISNTTVQPAPDFTGTLVVPATVNDGKNNSAPYQLKITVAANAATPETTPPQTAPPEITGQIPLSISMNQSIRIVLLHLLVSDPDSKYPDDFTLKVFSGGNYSLDGATVQPDDNFTGDLLVNVSVHDGAHESEPYPLKITVSGDTNEKPDITGQAGLKIAQGQSLTIKLSHLAIDDPDNKIPDDFTLSVFPGPDYTVSDHTITPRQDFLGNLTVGLTVHDGKVSSDRFDLIIQVIAPGRLEILGQESIESVEDSAVTIDFSQLLVNDPSNTFPQGFTIQISPGDNYEAVNNTVRPARDFAGNLSIPIVIRKGNLSSEPFSLLVIVHPENDAPELLNISTEPIAISGPGPWPLFSGADVIDVDDDHLLFAEVGFEPADFVPDKDQLHHEGTPNIHTVFDRATGTLFMIGRASLADYRTLITSISYTFNGSPDSVAADASKTVYIRVNDGKSTSAGITRLLMFDTDITLDIPTAFTPNNDNANDTWRITPLTFAEQQSTFIRVYDKRGNVVFESADPSTEWDGIFNGSPLPADVYFYTIEMDLSYRKVTYKGIVSILR